MDITKIIPFIGTALFIHPIHTYGQNKIIEKPNVLFIIADDMRPELGCYGVEDIKTPCIDRFAKSATVFQNAYCNIPVSGASRASIFTGAYPCYPNRFVSFDASADKDYPEAISLPQCFKDNGYYAISNGKVFHNISDNANSWSEHPWRLHPEGYGKDWAEYNKWELWQNGNSAQFIHSKTKRGPFCESAEVADTAYDDGMVAQQTISDLRRLKKQKEPFFLACGFWRPHLPFNAPKKYWDLYERDQIKLANNQFRPSDLPEQVTSSTEIRGYGKFTDTKDENFQREAKHGYYACMSYIDTQIGLILDELENSGLAEKTIVIILGDHGWHLGEHGFWGKHNLMNHSTRAPLLIKVPGSKGGNAKGIVEFVDLYPTLCELCGITPPGEQLQGKSFSPIIHNPKKRIKEYAFVQWKKGYNLISEKYSFAIWTNDNGKTEQMLFDHVEDPAENKNIASKPEVQKLIKKFRQETERKQSRLEVK